MQGSGRPSSICVLLGPWGAAPVCPEFASLALVQASVAASVTADLTRLLSPHALLRGRQRGHGRRAEVESLPSGPNQHATRASLYGTPCCIV